jgi:hypothetical protein
VACFSACCRFCPGFTLKLSLPDADYHGAVPATIIAKPNSNWHASIPGAIWVNFSGSGYANDAAGVYNYYVQFTTKGTATVTGEFSSDNMGTVYIGGGDIAGLSGPFGLKRVWFRLVHL